ncbi:MAG TPA: EAL domain-containing protein [Burkholderiales bacterium]|nr:EAL domain-containing protein [Burkholderiales bacterium]
MNERTQNTALLASGAGVWDWNLAEEFRLSSQLETALGFPARSFPGTLEAFLALLYPMDRDRVSAHLNAAKRNGSELSTEFRIVGGDGQFRWYAAQGEVLHGGNGLQRRLAGVIQEIGPVIVTERRMRRQQDVLLELVTHPSIRETVLESALEIVVRSAADTLEVNRVGIWLYDPSGGRMDCVKLYDRAERRYVAGVSLDKDRYPRYFQTLLESRALAVADARADPRTAELTDDYLVPFNIASLLDAAIRGRAGRAGIVCSEQAGLPRVWTLDEQSFAASIADFVAELIEADTRRQAEIALRSSRERYRAFIERSASAIWRVDMDEPVPTALSPEEQIRRVETHARLVEANSALVGMLGYAANTGIVGQRIADLIGETHLRAILNIWKDAGFRLDDHELRARFGSGEPRWISISMMGVVEAGAWVRVWGIMRDVTALHDAVAALSHQSRHDALTGLPNRTCFTDDLDTAIATAGQRKSRFALLVIDLDNFKEINDTLGHHVGDEMLSMLGRRLVAQLEPAQGTIARLGGDEFAVLLKTVNTIDDAGAFAVRLLASIREPFAVNDACLEISASIGVAFYPEDGVDASTLLRRGDIAMYMAKKSRSGYALYRAEDDLHTVRRLDLLNELRSAIRTRQIVVHYHPKVDLKENRVCGLEVLCRWPHPRHGMVPPDEFVRLAEMGDLIKPLTALIIDEALAQWVRWAKQNSRFKLAINLSPRNLVDDAIVVDMIDALKRHGVPAEFVELEVTEGAFLLDPERALALLGRLRALGLTLSIDDFGTGFSSLAYLRRMPISALKIDKSFVLGMAENAADKTIVNSTINLAHNLGLSVIAEGVETAALRDILVSLGCDIGQGYWFARPMPADDVLPWCAREYPSPKSSR